MKITPFSLWFYAGILSTIVDIVKLWSVLKKENRSTYCIVTLIGNLLGGPIALLLTVISLCKDIFKESSESEIRELNDSMETIRSMFK